MSGLLAAALEFLSFFLIFYIIGASLYVAQPVSFVVGLAISFSINRSWVFMRKDKTYSRLMLYAAVALCNIYISTYLILMFEEYIPAFSAKIAVMGCVALWNYIIFKKIIFKPTQ